ncbi:MAG: alpha/beta hydrolase [Gemmatimonadaceae bacterium]|nr:alpha/beta hydrolase [Gemmatimonadaceae bacterium]
MRRALHTAALALLVFLCRASFGGARPADAARAPAPMRVVRDVVYGPDARQRFDVYIPGEAKGAPVIFMVHGGGWSAGDKRARGVVDNKVARWLPRGLVVVSTNYRLLPAAKPLDQARDVARALAAAQRMASSWGADSSKFILMGHSAGGHLVTLVATAPAAREGANVLPWLGVVSLEGGAIDVPAIMRRAHARLYDRAFGRDSAFWRATTPSDALAAATAPMLLVCSARRGSGCADAERFAAKAAPSGTRVAILRETLTHAEADHLVGKDSAYTAGIERFLASLDSTVASRLAVR